MAHMPDRQTQIAVLDIGTHVFTLRYMNIETRNEMEPTFLGNGYVTQSPMRQTITLEAEVIEVKQMPEDRAPSQEEPVIRRALEEQHAELRAAMEEAGTIAAEDLLKAEYERMQAELPEDPEPEPDKLPLTATKGRARLAEAIALREGKKG